MNKLFALIAIFITSISFAQEKKIDGIIAIIGDEIITESDIQEAASYAKAQGSMVSDNCSFLENMIKEKLILYKAKQDTLIKVSNDEIQKEAQSRIDYFISVAGNEENVLNNFKARSMAELRTFAETSIKNQKYTERKMYSITSNVDVSPEYLKQFYNSHQSEFPYLSEEIEYAQILLYPELTKEHKQELTDKLSDIKKQIKEGASFADMARRYSEDPGSSERGGLIQNVMKGQMVKSFEAVAFNLEEGEISEPFETEYGFHIIYLEKRKGQILDLRHILLLSKPNQGEVKTALKKIEEIREEIRSEKITFTDAVKKYSDDKLTKNNGGIFYNTQTGDNRFEKIKLPTKILYHLSGLKKDDISEPFEDKDNERAVVKLLKIVNIIPAHKMNLDLDYNRVKSHAERSKENEVVDKWLENQIPSTFIKIKEPYNKCKFTIDWMRK